MMNVNGEYRIPAPSQRVWEALNDTETLLACIPGCEEVRAVGEAALEGRLQVRVGTVTSVFSGRMTVTEANPPSTWVLSAHVHSATSGWADGEVTVTLAADGPSATLLGYRGRLEPGGRLALVGQRVLQGESIRIANEFFSRLIERLQPRAPAAPPMDLAAPIPVPTTRPRFRPIAPAPAPARPVATVPEEAPARIGAKGRVAVIAGPLLWVLIVLLLFWPRG
jgi:carbon monoxide dehydrogenase subunit G